MKGSFLLTAAEDGTTVSIVSNAAARGGSGEIPAHAISSSSSFAGHHDVHHPSSQTFELAPSIARPLSRVSVTSSPSPKSPRGCDADVASSSSAATSSVARLAQGPLPSPVPSDEGSDGVTISSPPAPMRLVGVGGVGVGGNGGDGLFLSAAAAAVPFALRSSDASVAPPTISGVVVEDEPAILLRVSPTTLDLGDVAFGTECSASFEVSLDPPPAAAMVGAADTATAGGGEWEASGQRVGGECAFEVSVVGGTPAAYEPRVRVSGPAKGGGGGGGGLVARAGGGPCVVTVSVSFRKVGRQSVALRVCQLTSGGGDGAAAEEEIKARECGVVRVVATVGIPLYVHFPDLDPDSVGKRAPLDFGHCYALPPSLSPLPLPLARATTSSSTALSSPFAPLKAEALRITNVQFESADLMLYVLSTQPRQVAVFWDEALTRPCADASSAANGLRLAHGETATAYVALLPLLPHHADSGACRTVSAALSVVGCDRSINSHSPIRTYLPKSKRRRADARCARTNPSRCSTTHSSRH